MDRKDWLLGIQTINKVFQLKIRHIKLVNEAPYHWIHLRIHYSAESAIPLQILKYRFPKDYQLKEEDIYMIIMFSQNQIVSF